MLHHVLRFVDEWFQCGVSILDIRRSRATKICYVCVVAVVSIMTVIVDTVLQSVAVAV